MRADTHLHVVAGQTGSFSGESADPCDLGNCDGEVSAQRQMRRGLESRYPRNPLCALWVMDWNDTSEAAARATPSALAC
jgi:hypothetical protein